MDTRPAARCEQNDLEGGRVAWLVWGIPVPLFIVGLGWAEARPWLWIPAFGIAGTACVVNASRCGRLHCFITGPLFLLAALTTALDAVGVLAVDWQGIGGTVVIGTFAAYGIEWIRGKYIRSRAAD